VRVEKKDNNEDEGRTKRKEYLGERKGKSEAEDGKAERTTTDEREKEKKKKREKSRLVIWIESTVHSNSGH